MKSEEVNYAAVAMDEYESLVAIEDSIRQKESELEDLEKATKDALTRIKESAKNCLNTNLEGEYIVRRGDLVLKLRTYIGKNGVEGSFTPMCIEEEV